MFDAIVPRYDLVNDVLSAGMDRRWRRTTVRALHAVPGLPVLDLGCGTGRLAGQVQGHRVVGLDVSGPMLRVALDGGLARAVQGSAFRLPFVDAAFGGATSGFVLRNLDDLPAAFAELARVLRPGAGLAIVDITEPTEPLRRKVFDAYFRVAAPLVGGLVGRREAYRYLVRSVAHLPSPAVVAAMLRDAGCERVRWRALAPGMVTLWTARRV
jgi:demethylmenaquinone methyltransferase/2-methoxy-6-polyprenyl-1,4-benzoquinol methylase